VNATIAGPSHGSIRQELNWYIALLSSGIVSAPCVCHASGIITIIASGKERLELA
jgi:hypothetical protein